LGFTVPFVFHFAFDDSARELAGIFIRHRVIVERTHNAERYVSAGDFAVADVGGGRLAAVSPSSFSTRVLVRSDPPLRAGMVQM
jgi:hypothetical protein